MRVTNISSAPRAVRTGLKASEPDKLITIAPGSSEEVEGFNPKDRFNAGMIRDRLITVGASSDRERDNSTVDERKQAALQQAVTDAENEVKQAKDEKEDADKALAENDTGANKAAAGKAQSKLNAAENKLDKARKAFNG